MQGRGCGNGGSGKGGDFLGRKNSGYGKWVAASAVVGRTGVRGGRAGVYAGKTYPHVYFYPLLSLLSYSLPLCVCVRACVCVRVCVCVCFLQPSPHTHTHPPTHPHPHTHTHTHTHKGWKERKRGRESTTHTHTHAHTHARTHTPLLKKKIARWSIQTMIPAEVYRRCATRRI